MRTNGSDPSGAGSARAEAGGARDTREARTAQRARARGTAYGITRTAQHGAQYARRAARHAERHAGSPCKSYKPSSGANVKCARTRGPVLGVRTRGPLRMCAARARVRMQKEELAAAERRTKQRAFLAVHLLARSFAFLRVHSYLRASARLLTSCRCMHPSMPLQRRRAVQSRTDTSTTGAEQPCADVEGSELLNVVGAELSVEVKHDAECSECGRLWDEYAARPQAHTSTCAAGRST